MTAPTFRINIIQCKISDVPRVHAKNKFPQDKDNLIIHLNVNNKNKTIITVRVVNNICPMNAFYCVTYVVTANADQWQTRIVTD